MRAFYFSIQGTSGDIRNYAPVTPVVSVPVPVHSSIS